MGRCNERHNASSQARQGGRGHLNARQAQAHRLTRGEVQGTPMLVMKSRKRAPGS